MTDLRLTDEYARQCIADGATPKAIWVREYTHQLKRSGEWPHVYEVETWHCWWVRLLRLVY